ncbi:hypothetical protein SAMN05192589_102137 [Paracidovorax valerianellae]|uniref:FIG146805: Plasmid related protein n=1 Tax=Paracidovorax valerianellae TaxID=187868 RepID=A0A1G6LD58_9BURK|nr:hypothetical protein [Paracidovorax valerianellae]SDC41141.1 hypothetical protein SAMN05192589_102137 [Paracidovorax valerianellae]
MSSSHRTAQRQNQLFPIGALVYSEGVYRLVREGRLDPLPYVQRHMRGDWGDVSDEDWHANHAALPAGERLGSFYVVTRELNLHVFTLPDRSATHVVLPSEI